MRLHTLRQRHRGRRAGLHGLSGFPLLLSNPQDLMLFRRFFRQIHGILADIAPTLLEVMGVEIPAEMTGKSLIEKK